MKQLMQKIGRHKVVFTVIAIVVAVLFLLVGKDPNHGQSLAFFAGAASVTLTEEEKKGFSENEQKVILAFKKLAAQTEEKLNAGAISKEELQAAISGIKSELSNNEIKELKDEVKRLEEIAKTQGTTLSELNTKMLTGGQIGKTIAEQLKADEQALKTVYANGVGQKTYMLSVNAKGEMVMTPYDAVSNKAAGPHASIAGVGGVGNVSSVGQTIDAATLLRLGSQDAAIMSQYRNSPWVFSLCNLVNAGTETPWAIWYDEQAKDGSSATVAEGATKPAVQYKYVLRTDTYKKEAMLVSFTDEFSMDFVRLQDDILNKSRVDLVNRINTAILPRIIAAATAYNTATQFKDGSVVTNANDFDVIAAMAAQVENATYGAVANSAVMSTFKKHRLGITKDSTGAYLNGPSSISNLAFVGNPDLAAGQVLVGDFKNYNIILRGGLIVKVGYNGTDFAENKFSVVLEQYYYDYISAARTAAIVKGPDFATVKTALTA